MSKLEELRQLHDQAKGRAVAATYAEPVIWEYQDAALKAFPQLLAIAEAAEYAENLLLVEIDVVLARDGDPPDTVIHARTRLREALDRLEQA